MDQNMMMFIAVVVALSMVTVVIVIARLPKQMLITWAVVDAILTGIAVWYFFFNTA